MPFNSSTPLLYYNKTAFAAAGPGPRSTPPKNFDEIMAMSEKLTVKDANGKVTRYGFGMGNYGWFFEQWQGKMAKHYVDNNNGRGAEPATKVVFDENGAARRQSSTCGRRLIDSGMMHLPGPRQQRRQGRLHLRQHHHHPGIHRGAQDAADQRRRQL